MTKAKPFQCNAPVVMPEHRGEGQTPGCWSRQGKMVRVVCPQCEMRQAEFPTPPAESVIQLDCSCGFNRLVVLLDLHVKGGT